MLLPSTSLSLLQYLILVWASRTVPLQCLAAFEYPYPRLDGRQQVIYTVYWCLIRPDRFL